MFDVGFFELCIVGVVALLVIGPERLPRAARTAGLWAGRAKRMMSQVKADIDNQLRQEELEELKALRESKDLTSIQEEISQFGKSLKESADPETQPDQKNHGPKGIKTLCRYVVLNR